MNGTYRKVCEVLREVGKRKEKRAATLTEALTDWLSAPLFSSFLNCVNKRYHCIIA
jgi:hypothetical protein